MVVHPKEETRVRAKVEVVKVKEGKEAVATREPDMKMELKRGSMRDKWGLTLVHRTGEGGRVELGVSKVGPPAYLLPVNVLLFLSRWRCSAQLPRQALFRVTLNQPFMLILF